MLLKRRDQPASIELQLILAILDSYAQKRTDAKKRNVIMGIIRDEISISMCVFWCVWVCVCGIGHIALYLVTPCIVLLPFHSAIVLPTVFLTMQRPLIFVLTALSKCFFSNMEERVELILDTCVHNTQYFIIVIYALISNWSVKRVESRVVTSVTCPVLCYHNAILTIVGIRQ